MRKITIVITLIGFSFASFVSAAVLVPNNSPLQPMPENTAPNISNNINTPDSEINQNLEANLPISETEEQETILPPTDPNQDIAAQADAVSQSATSYWILLLIGIAGILGIGAWTYKRFVRNY